jgi:hypothetical protein
MLAFNLMMLQEIKTAIKCGYPSHIVHVLKFWNPIFYGGGSYNYSHETMKLLYNYKHDWPQEAANTVFASMLVNLLEEEGQFKEGDMDVEHYNRKSKDHTDDPNCTPKTLEEITPAIDIIWNTSAKLYSELGIKSINLHHTHVKQQEDIIILTDHFTNSNIFKFTAKPDSDSTVLMTKHDSESNHCVRDLFKVGQQRLSSPSGGHAIHLARHYQHLLKAQNTNLLLLESEIQLLKTHPIEVDETVKLILQNNKFSA